MAQAPEKGLTSNENMGQESERGQDRNAQSLKRKIMAESLFCPNQLVPSKEYKENYDNIKWEIIEGETSEEEEKANNA